MRERKERRSRKAVVACAVCGGLFVYEKYKPDKKYCSRNCQHHRERTLEERDKKSKKLKGKCFFTPEQIESIRLKRLGKKFSAEVCKNMSEGLKHAYAAGTRISWNKGLTKETDERLKIASQKQKLSDYKRWNKGLTKETDERVRLAAQKLSVDKKGKATWNKGLTKETDSRLCLSEEHKKNISKATKGISKNKGQVVSEETRKKLSEYRGEKHWGFGKTISLEKKFKLSQALKKAHAEGRAVSPFKGLRLMYYKPVGSPYIPNGLEHRWIAVAAVPKKPIVVRYDVET